MASWKKIWAISIAGMVLVMGAACGEGMVGGQTEGSEGDDSSLRTILQVNVNTASAEDLDRVPRITKAKADRIVKFRKENGPFFDLTAIRQILGRSAFLTASRYLTVGQTCGGIAALTCQAGEYCFYPVDGPIADAAGICLPFCTEYRCGAIQHCELEWVECITTPCPPIPTCKPNTCETTACPDGTHCETQEDGVAVCVDDNPCALVDCRPGYTCEARNGQAECVPETTTCMCPLYYDPVCGTDGKTYGNACEARCAGVSVDFKGTCEKKCGNTVCGDGFECCNASCSMCVREGMMCTQQACTD